MLNSFERKSETAREKEKPAEKRANVIVGIRRNDIVFVWDIITMPVNVNCLFNYNRGKSLRFVNAWEVQIFEKVNLKQKICRMSEDS